MCVTTWSSSRSELTRSGRSSLRSSRRLRISLIARRTTSAPRSTGRSARRGGCPHVSVLNCTSVKLTRSRDGEVGGELGAAGAAEARVERPSRDDDQAI